MVERVATAAAASLAPPNAPRVVAAPLAAAAIVTAACWAATIYGASTMTGTMPMPGGWSMSMAWMRMPGQSSLDAAVMFLMMWQVMMVAMMLPSAMPMTLLYRRLAVARRQRGAAAAPSAVLLTGYFAIWLMFGLVAYVIGFIVSALAMASEPVSLMIPAATGLVLVLAGVYQLTPWKRLCLRHCRSPMSFFAACWKPGWWGTLKLGAHHGAYCAGCCWGLMLIQLAIGVMNLPLMAVLAAVIWIEKLWRHGERVAMTAGWAAIVGGAAIAAGLL